MASTQHKQHQVAADKLSEQLRELKDEDNFGDAGDCLWRYPVFESRELTETERDLRDWGYVFGLAFGLAIGANPGMPHAAAAELAYWPARRVFTEWSGEIEDPVAKREEAIRRLVRQFEKAEDARETRIFSGHGFTRLEMTDELQGAIHDLATWARG